MARPPLNGLFHLRLILLAVLALVLPGCVTTESWVFSKKQPLSDQAVSEVATQWHGLGVTQDSANKGQPLPGIVGRMYLFPSDRSPPVLAEGKAVVDMTFLNEEGKPSTGHWEFDSKTLQLLARKDMVGQGYTLFLPWPSYNPSVTQVQMRVSFVTPKGLPVYAQPSMVHIRPAGPIPIEERQWVAPQPKS